MKALTLEYKIGVKRIYKLKLIIIEQMKTKKLFNLNFAFTSTFQLLPNIMGVRNEGIFIMLPFYGTIIIS